MKKKVLSLMLVLALIGTMLVGCGNGESGASEAETTQGGRTELVMWDYYGSSYHGKLQEMANLFNASQSDYKLTVEQGGDIINKMENMKQKDYPSLFMCKINELEALKKSSYTAPLQQFLDADEDKWTEDMLDVVKRGYTYDDVMVGAPIGVSFHGFFVNVTMLNAAGYTLEDVTSFEKLAEIATAAYNKNLCTYGYCWYDGVDILDMLTYQGVDIVDAGNGYDGKVTKCLYNEGETYKSLKKLVTLMADMIDSGVASENVSEYQGGKAPFLNGELLFWTATNSAIHLLEEVEDFEWAYIPLMGVDDNAEYKNGGLSAGAGVFIADTGNEKEMQGAYEFIKFMAEKENMIEWCTYGGYIPYTKTVLADPAWTTWRDENFASAAKLEEQLLNAPETLVYARNPVNVQLEAENMNIFSNIIMDPKGDLDSYIQQAADSINNSIEMKNMRAQ